MINLLLFILLALFWGGSFLFIKEVIETIPSFTAAFYRVFFACIFLVLIYAKKIKFPKELTLKQWALVISGSLCSVGIPFSLLFWGEQFVSGGLAGVLNGTVPLWTLLSGLVFFSDMVRFNKTKLFGVFVGAVGIYFIFLPKLNFTGQLNELYGLISITLMSLFYGLGINLNNRVIAIYHLISRETNLVLQQFFSCLYLILVAIYFDGIPDFSFLSNVKASMGILYLSLLSTAFAFMIFFRLIKEIGPVRASAVTFFVPIVALGLDVIINQNIPSHIQFVGTGIILLSLIFIRKD